jgi:hypothetical protein
MPPEIDPLSFRSTIQLAENVCNIAEQVVGQKNFATVLVSAGVQASCLLEI